MKHSNSFIIVEMNTRDDKIVLIFSSIKSRQIRAILSEAAQCELEGPLITGPMTSLKILG